MPIKKQNGPGRRSPLTDAELKGLAPEDLLRIRLSDDEKLRLRAINAAREADRLRRVASLRLEEAPIVADLMQVGIAVNSVADLVGRREPYPAAVPVLLKHLRRAYSDPLKSTLARALAIPEPEVRRAWPILVDEYRIAATAPGDGLSKPRDTRQAAEGLACALAVAASDETIDQLIELVRDNRLGESRVLLLSGLRKLRDPGALKALADAANDPVLRKEISSWRHSSAAKERPA